jgi:hypothetical protein
MYLDGNLIPIGWSKDGFFAYAEYAEYTRGSTGIDKINRSAVCIMNTITDEIVEEIVNETWLMYNIKYTDEALKDISFEEFWQIKENDITSLLKKYNIVSCPDMELSNIDRLKELYGISVYLEDSCYDWKEDPLNEDHDPYWSNIFSPYYYSYNLVANRKEKTKIIGKVGTVFTTGEIIGYYKSPFENRIIVYIKSRMDESSPAYIDSSFYKYIGCHLIVGFK